MSGIWEYIASFFISTAAAATVVAQLPAAPTPDIAPLTIPNTQQVASKLFKIKVTVSELTDIKVKEGDSVGLGQILADRTKERNKLEANKRELQSSLNILQKRKVPEPQPPAKIPEIAPLPDPNYTEEEALIEAAKLRFLQSEREYLAQVRSLNSEPAGEAAAVEKAKVAVAEKVRLVDIQETKIETIKGLNNLPAAVIQHETLQLERMRAELAQLESEKRLAEGKLTDTARDRQEKLATLEIQRERARNDINLAEARLESAKKRREDEKYKHSINLILRQEQKAQAEQIYSRQLQEHERDLSIREAQAQNIRDKINLIEDELLKISSIKSPVSGKIRRVKNLGQNNNSIDFELSIVVDSSTSDRTEFIKPAGKR